LQVFDRILCRELIDLVHGETDHGLLGNLSQCRGLSCSGEQISSQPLPADDFLGFCLSWGIWPNLTALLQAPASGPAHQDIMLNISCWRSHCGSRD
jgi:hypothetical protein